MRICVGKRFLFVELRDVGQPEEQPGSWGWYPLSEIPALVKWLDGGSQAEFELAEDIYQAFRPYMAAQEVDCFPPKLAQEQYLICKFSR